MVFIFEKDKMLHLVTVD